jgi:hypothetical protein
VAEIDEVHHAALLRQRQLHRDPTSPRDALLGCGSRWRA